MKALFLLPVHMELVYAPAQFANIPFYPQEYLYWQRSSAVSTELGIIDNFLLQ